MCNYILCTWQCATLAFALLSPPTQCFPLFPGRTGPGNRMRGSGKGSNVRGCLSLVGDRFLVGPLNPMFSFVSWQDWACQQDERLWSSGELWSWQQCEKAFVTGRGYVLGRTTTNPIFSFVSWQDWTWQQGWNWQQDERLWRALE